MLKSIKASTQIENFNLTTYVYMEYVIIDDLFTARIPEKCDVNPICAFIKLYESKNLPVIPNLIRFAKQAHMSINYVKEYIPKSKKQYLEELQKYILLI